MAHSQSQDWSASYYNSDDAWSVDFSDTYLDTDGSNDRCNGQSVRLVRPAD